MAEEALSNAAEFASSAWLRFATAALEFATVAATGSAGRADNRALRKTADSLADDDSLLTSEGAVMRAG